MKRLFIAFFTSLALTSCFDLKETVRIDGNRVEIAYTLLMDSLIMELVDPDSLAAQIRKENPEAQVDVMRDADNTMITIRYITQITRTDKVDSTLRIRLRGNRILLRKEVISPGADTTNVHLLFSGRLYIFELRTKKPIIRSNAHQRIGDTLHRWLIPLDSLIMGNVNLVIRAEVER